MTVEKALENRFNKPGISRPNLLSYAKDNLNRLTANNGTGLYTIQIGYLTIYIASFDAELQLDDSTKNLRKGQTRSVDEMTVVFSKTMSEFENEISRKVGGKTSPSFYEFYPNGQTEYSLPTRQEMDVFIPRIRIATNKHHTELGLELTDTLLALDTDYNLARGSQNITIAKVSANKTLVTSNQLALANGLNKSFHEIAAMHSDDIAPCIGLFNFNLLYSNEHHARLVLKGDIAVSGLAVLLNKLLTDNLSIEIKCTGINASLWLWLGATATDTDDRMAINIGPGPIVTIKPSDIGDLKKTFLLMKNDSSVNTASYEVTIIG